MTRPQCPPWCTDQSVDHIAGLFDSVDDKTLIRTHSAEFGSVAIVQDEECADGVATLLPMTIHSYVPEIRDLTVEQARQAAGDFLAAAALFERIVSGAVR